MSILATDEWSPLYNKISQDVIANGTTQSTLNNHLYSALILSLKDSVETTILGMPHLFGDGVGVLHALRTTYKGKLTNVEVMKLHGKLLGGLHFRGREESIDQFAARTIQMSKDLEEHNISVAPSALKSSFISGLGPDFHDIIKDFNRNKLDDEWKPLLIRDLIEPAR